MGDRAARGVDGARQPPDMALEALLPAVGGKGPLAVIGIGDDVIEPQPDQHLVPALDHQVAVGGIDRDLFARLAQDGRAQLTLPPQSRSRIPLQPKPGTRDDRDHSGPLKIALRDSVGGFSTSFSEMAKKSEKFVFGRRRQSKKPLRSRSGFIFLDRKTEAYSAVDAVSTFTPGPMVEDSEIFLT